MSNKTKKLHLTCIGRNQKLPKKSMKKKSFFNKKLSLKFCYLVIFFIIGVFLSGTTIYFSFLKDDVDKRKLSAELETKTILLEQNRKEIREWKEQSADIIEIKNEYKEIVKEIIDLLYLKNMPVGGFILDEIKATDEITIKMMRNTVNAFREEQEWMSEIKGYLVARKQFINEFPFIYPVNKGLPSRISSDFGFREDVFKEDVGLHFHTGIDFPGKQNDPINATADGKVVYIKSDHEMYGKIVIIEHNFNLFTYYAHLNVISTKIGQNIKRGDVVGLMGNTGKSLGVHLHYEVRLGKDSHSVPLDPKMFLTSNY